jgi:hypothetical protein
VHGVSFTYQYPSDAAEGARRIATRRRAPVAAVVALPDRLFGCWTNTAISLGDSKPATGH